MKTFSILAAAALVTVATADVQLFTDNECSANRQLFLTKAGQCYNIDPSTKSAFGCSVGHNLRVFANADCDISGGTAEKAPQKCAALDGTQIKSIKCRA